MKNKGILLVISGPSGAGKGTLAKLLLGKRDNIVLSVSATTRDIRPGEIPGKTYHYLEKQEFLEGVSQGLFLEYAKVYDNYYGTPRDTVMKALQRDQDVILEIDIQGAMQVKRNFTDAVFVFVVPPSLEVLRERILKRDREPMEEIERRLREVDNELSYIGQYDYVVVNGEADKAVGQLACILEAERCRSARRLYKQEVEDEANETTDCR